MGENERVYGGMIFTVDYLEDTNEYYLKTRGVKFHYFANELMEELRDAISHIRVHTSTQNMIKEEG